MPLKSKLPQRFLNDVHTESSGPSSATQSTDNNLCHFCRGINIESLSAPGGYEHVPSSRAFSDRCALCKLIRDNSFVKFYFETPLYLQLSHHLSDSGSKEAYLTLPNGIDREDPDKTWVFIITEPGDPSSAHAVPTFRNLTSTASSESLEVVQRWINHCLTSHDCSKSLTGGEFKRPTRLLDVNAFESSCLDLRLVETIVSNSHYAALSYCWGIQMDTTYKTTLSTLEKRKDRIEFTDLPLTYQHAVEVTRNLGLRYLWIDALCIIQGCLADWQHESARMADVYGGSFLTISADWSSNSNSGCYNSLVGRGNIDTQQLICVRSQLSDSRKSSLYFGVSFDPSLKYLEALAVFKRAWACQERLLSPRILHYTDEQLLWECRRAFCAEDGIPRQHESVFPGFVPKMRVFGTNGEKLDLWYNRIIDIYSKGELTIPIDRLPAMSALARIWAQDLQSPYLAGMWLHGLWIALCWYRLGDNELTVSPTDYIAPSWSWASVNASVKWLIQSNGMFEEQSVRIEEASMELDGEDPFGRVLRGSIRLSGHIQKGRICRETISVASEGKYIELSGPVYLDYAGETLNAVDCLLIALEGGQMLALTALGLVASLRSLTSLRAP